jgi:hypothetical protein
MTTKMILIENLSPAEANLVESIDESKNYFLSGIMCQAEIRNGNGRIYPLSEIKKAVEYVNQKIKEGNYIMGELNHPDNLSIDLKNVSHIITEMKLDGNNGVGKCKLLNTPSGQIARSLLEGGVRLGVSTRGTGNVTNEGLVEDFSFVTVDIVATPSAPDAYPNLVREALENNKILTLAEAVVHDEKAQKYFKQEMQKFIDSLLRR